MRHLARQEHPVQREPSASAGLLDAERSVHPERKELLQHPEDEEALAGHLEAVRHPAAAALREHPERLAHLEAVAAMEG